MYELYVECNSFPELEFKLNGILQKLTYKKLDTKIISGLNIDMQKLLLSRSALYSLRSSARLTVEELINHFNNARTRVESIFEAHDFDRYLNFLEAGGNFIDLFKFQRN
jgi:hypothetical protein